MPTRAALVFAVLCAVGRVPLAHAQTNAEVNASLQFDFSNPGARSLALAGAFVALADDATAAYTNPAGLLRLTRPEVSIEGRHWGFSTSFLDRGNAAGTATGTNFDSLNGLAYGRSNVGTGGVSFASAVYPTTRWAAAGYFHTRANFKNSYRSAGPFFGPGLPRLFPVDGAIDMDITNVGGAVSFLAHPNVMIGLGVARTHYRATSIVTRYAVNDFFGPPQYGADRVLVDLETAGDQSKASVNAGFLWKIADEATIGGVYRKGASFDVEASWALGPGHPAFGLLQPVSFPAVFNVPDVVGLGVALRPTDAFTISADWNRVRYSQLTKGFRDVLDRDRYSTGFVVDDGNELRVGAQFVTFALQNPVALRFGVWSDPDHNVRFEGGVPPQAPDFPDFIERRSFDILFKPGTTQVHVTGGVGITVGQRWQADVGFDHSDYVTTAAFSLVARF